MPPTQETGNFTGGNGTSYLLTGSNNIKGSFGVNTNNSMVTMENNGNDTINFGNSTVGNATNNTITALNNGNDTISFPEGNNTNNTVTINNSGTNTVTFQDGGNANNKITVENTGNGTDTVTFGDGGSTGNLITLSGGGKRCGDFQRWRQSKQHGDTGEWHRHCDVLRQRQQKQQCGIGHRQ